MIWCTKECKKEHDLVHEEMLKKNGARIFLKKKRHGCCMRKCQKKIWCQNCAINCGFTCKIYSQKKKDDLKHHLEHDGFRSSFYANPEVGASKEQICGAKPRKAHILKLSCVMMCDV
jgi:hypothetical protein